MNIDTKSKPELLWLSVADNQIVNGDGTPIVLKGFGLGGWMNMENFITGYGGAEVDHRAAMKRALGEKVYHRFFDGFLSAFFNQQDADYLGALGTNSIRLPVNFRHLNDDMAPDVIIEEGWRHLDRVIDECARAGIYSIIDLHAAPGGQNGHWHSDTPYHRPQLWEQRHFQDRTVMIWEAIADRYKDNPWVGGYNFLNEPASPEPEALVSLYARLEKAVRAIDRRHALFLDGNRFSNEFPGFGEPLPNSVYAVHQYPGCCPFDGGPYPGYTRGEYYDKARVEREFLQKVDYIRSHDVPIWVGEFGPVYTDEPGPDAMKRQLLVDELDIYHRHNASWSLWTYKDLGMMGIVRPNEDTPWLERTKAVREKKALLATDVGGSNDKDVQDVLAPLLERMDKEFPSFQPYPWGIRSYVNRLVRAMMFSEPMAIEFAECFAGISEEQADVIVASYSLDNCRTNEAAREIVARDCARNDVLLPA